MSKGYTVENYGRKSQFASFLPGISGKKGIPIWCHYVNRGQGVVSFGVEDKDHAIMEFYPAHQAYQNVKSTGFRTFLRVNGQYAEAFGDVETAHGMTIERNGLKIWEKNENYGIHTKVNYFTLPGENIGGLVRKVTLTNISEQSMDLEVLDGMPALVPYGVNTWALKEMGQTSKAWMQVEDTDSRVPYYKARASMEDTAAVTAVKGGNFSLAMDEKGELLAPVVDPEAVFAYDNSLQIAKNFAKNGLGGVYTAKQVLSNQFPASFYGVSRTLAPGENIIIYELIGQVVGKDVLKRFLKKGITPAYFEAKAEEAYLLTEDLCKVITTKTGNPDFDEYCGYTYMDNVLRGGYPIVLPGDKIFYMYSRKHGDLERDYNYFRMLPEFYSQGNGNFRDVNQNRRMDTFFTPYVGRENIKKFFGLIQLDGYNPLAVEKVTYTLDEEVVEEIIDPLTQEQKEELFSYLTEEFTPGGFYQKLEEIGILNEQKQDELFEQVIARAKSNLNADFGEGYWSDHWTYNLDLIENYLAVYPEKEAELLMEQEYTYFCCQVPILPRIRRYVKTENGIRQYQFLDEKAKRTDGEKLVRAQFGVGEPVKVSLLEKLVLLCTAKYAALDVYGMGVEMEGGKPGWYDALNGLPGLFGSSMAETYELARIMEYTIKALDKCPAFVGITKEVADYLQAMDTITLMHKNDIVRGKQLLEFWNQRNDVKEAYMSKTFQGISGEKTRVETGRLSAMLGNLLDAVHHGIQKAISLSDGVAPAYFTYEVEDYIETREGIIPEYFTLVKVPYFLEGPVRYLKLENSRENKKNLYAKVKDSDMYDTKLQMYKVNASLANASFEVGRAKAFTPGWLENESIWLHMEYKYLLELLKSGLYEEYMEDFSKVVIPFQNPEVYGRSIYENSSFIASSKNPNEAYHGKGFVARLSGSTVEFLQMWKIMMFGQNTFQVENGKLSLQFEPVLPACLVGEEKTVEVTFLGNTKVVYHFAEQKDYIPGEYKVTEMRLKYSDGSAYQTANPIIGNLAAYDVREGKVERIDIWVK
uniref:hypothetical protein n=1 Tax=Acetatifactor sp. TaxID=1872090 RepID=UPI004055F806